MVTLRKPPVARMTPAEFLAWEPDDPSARSWRLPRRDANGDWPDEPVTLGPDEAVTLESTGFSAPSRSFHRPAVLA